MADKNSPSKQANSDDPRQDRLKAALKANLARRKAQARARQGEQSNKNASDED